MGFYHYLRTVDKKGNYNDIGGYSKGCSQTHWVLAFTPDDFHNNLEEVVATQNPRIAKIGYETTVRLAVARLERVKDLLQESEYNLKRPKIERIYQELSNKVWSLHFKLERENPDNILELDQTDGFEYALKWEGNHITGMKEWALYNEAENNEKILAELQECISFEEALQEFAACLPNEDVEEFQAELYEYIAHDERGYGPSPISLFLWEDESSIKSDNPSNLFTQLIYSYAKTFDEQLANTNSEDESYPYIVREKEQSIPILYNYMSGCLRFMEEMNQIHQQR